MPGIEPGAFHMQSERSTAELHPLHKYEIGEDLVHLLQWVHYALTRT